MALDIPHHLNEPQFLKLFLHIPKPSMSFLFLLSISAFPYRVC